MNIDELIERLLDAHLTYTEYNTQETLDEWIKRENELKAEFIRLQSEISKLGDYAKTN
jgi:hypothetical protein